MRRAAEKANKNRASKARRKEAGFQKPSQADESAVRDIRRREVFAEEDPRLWTAKRRKFHGKNRNALAMRVHTCAIHPNWVNSSEALYDLTRFARSQFWGVEFIAIRKMQVPVVWNWLRFESLRTICRESSVAKSNRNTGNLFVLGNNTVRTTGSQYLCNN